MTNPSFNDWMQQQFPQVPQTQFPGVPQVPQQYVPQAPVPGLPPYPQQYAPQPQFQPPAPPLAKGTIDDYFDQPSISGGPSWSWRNPDGSGKPVGTSYMGIVERTITNADIQQQTQPGTGQPATYRDGRPKFVMKVPLIVQATADFPEGKATWFVTGQARDELVRAMAEAGAPAGPPEAGAAVQVTLVGRKPSRTPGNNPSNQVQIRYGRPHGAPSVASPAAAPSPMVDAMPVVQAMTATTPVAPGAAPPAAPQPPFELSADQQALLARLVGQPQE